MKTRILSLVFVLVLTSACAGHIDPLKERREKSLSRLNNFLAGEGGPPKVRNILAVVRDYITSASLEDLKATRIIYAEALPHPDGVQILVYWVGERLIVDQVAVRNPHVDDLVKGQLIEYPGDSFLEKAEADGVNVGAMFSFTQVEGEQLKQWFSLVGHPKLTLTLNLQDHVVTTVGALHVEPAVLKRWAVSTEKTERKTSGGPKGSNPNVCGIVDDVAEASRGGRAEKR